MEDKKKTKDQLIKELEELRKRFFELKLIETEHKKAEEALKESEEKYRQLFHTESDAIMIFDAVTKKFIDVNSSCKLLYGYGRDEFLKLKVTDISAEPEDTLETIKNTINPDSPYKTKKCFSY